MILSPLAQFLRESKLGGAPPVKSATWSVIQSLSGGYRPSIDWPALLPESFRGKLGRDETMNLRVHQFELAITLLIALTFAGGVSAQEQKFHHCKLFDLGTFGGPHNHINADDFLSAYSGDAQDVNNAGTVIGWADTGRIHPHPIHTGPISASMASALPLTHFSGRTASSMIWAPFLPGGASSATSWISANGLIAGASQNGETDPLLRGFPEDRAVLWRNGHPGRRVRTRCPQPK